MPDNDAAKQPVVDWTRVLGGALAAVSSAVLLSRLGAVGTIAGAALGSIVVSVATSLYAHGLSRSQRRMVRAQELALRRVGIAQAEVHRARRRQGAAASEAHLDRADEHLAEARDRLESQPPPEPRGARLGQLLAQLPWKRVALVAALMFALALAAVTAFELIAGRPVSSYTGGTDSHHGTSFSNLEHSGGNPTTPAPTPSGPASPTSSPSESTSSSPSGTPSASPSSTPTPTLTPSPTPTEAPSPSESGPAPGG
jgi:hypothetical protein